MEEKQQMTAKEASIYASQHDTQGKGLSVSYLVRAAQKGRIRGVMVDTGPVPFWLFSKEAIDEYLTSPRSRGRKPKAEDQS